MNCSCGRIMNGHGDTGARNWDPGCVEHGTQSEWYRTEGKTHLDAQAARSVELQRQAREARRKWKEQDADQDQT